MGNPQGRGGWSYRQQPGAATGGSRPHGHARQFTVSVMLEVSVLVGGSRKLFVGTMRAARGRGLRNSGGVPLPRGRLASGGRRRLH